MERHIENFGVSGFSDISLTSPLSLAMLIAAIVATFSVRRDTALIPMIVILCIVPFSHRLSIATVDFPFVRLLIMALVARAVFFGERPHHPMLLPEKLIVGFIVIFGLVSGLSGGGWMAEIGRTVTLLLLAYAVRVYVSQAQLMAITTVAALISFPTALAFWHEHTTTDNLYRAFGGVSDATNIRMGEVRARGPFFHPIYAGVFWITFSCFFIWRGLIATTLVRRAYWMAAVVATVVVGFSTSSSTPIMGFAAIVMCWCAFWARDYRKWFLPGTAVVVIALDVVMKAPVWHLIARVGSAEGSTSYFRFKLIDAFFANVGEWFFLGTRSTAHWFWGAQDIVNQFVYYGVRGGAASLFLFIAVVWMTIRLLSKRFEQAPTKTRAERNTRLLIWAFLASISASLITFIGVSYFGQIATQLYMIIFGGLAFARTLGAEQKAPSQASLRMKRRRLARAEA